MFDIWYNYVIQHSVLGQLFSSVYCVPCPLAPTRLSPVLPPFAPCPPTSLPYAPCFLAPFTPTLLPPYPYSPAPLPRSLYPLPDSSGSGSSECSECWFGSAATHDHQQHRTGGASSPPQAPSAPPRSARSQPTPLQHSTSLPTPPTQQVGSVDTPTCQVRSADTRTCQVCSADTPTCQVCNWHSDMSGV